MYDLNGALGDTPVVQVTIGEAVITHPAASTSKSAWATLIDVFLDLYIHASRDKKVLLVNNSFQLLWRASIAQGLPTTNPYMVQLDRIMSEWIVWKGNYDSSLRVPYISDDPNWGAQLDDWAKRYQQLVLSADTAVRNFMQQKYGIDEAALDRMQADPWDAAGRDAIKRLSEVLGSSWFWPAFGVLGALYVGSKLLGFVRTLKHA